MSIMPEENQETKPVKPKPAKKAVKKATKKAATKPAKKAVAKKATKKASKKATKKKKTANAMGRATALDSRDAKKISAKKGTPRGRQAGINKAEFVRARASLSTKELIEAAKKEKFALSANYIYVIRGKAKTTKPAAKTTRGPGRPKTNGASNGHMDGDQMLFLNGVAESVLNEDFMQQVARRVAVMLLGE